jgi:hypothetical protein
VSPLTGVDATFLEATLLLTDNPHGLLVLMCALQSAGRRAGCDDPVVTLDTDINALTKHF